MIERHERGEGRKGLEVCNCLIDEGGPLGTGLQEQVPNHHWRLRAKAVVVSAGGWPAPTEFVTGRERAPPRLAHCSCSTAWLARSRCAAIAANVRPSPSSSASRPVNSCHRRTI